MTKKILMVEDDTFLQELATKKLEDIGYKVAIANDGNEALEVVAENEYDLILLDLLLPNLSGQEFLAKIKENKATSFIPVIVFSNISDSEEIKRVIELGADEYLIKSNFTLDELITYVNDALD